VYFPKTPDVFLRLSLENRASSLVWIQGLCYCFHATVSILWSQPLSMCFVSGEKVRSPCTLCYFSWISCLELFPPGCKCGKSWFFSSKSRMTSVWYHNLIKKNCCISHCYISHLYEQVAGTVSARNPKADAIIEVRAYLEEPLVAKNEDPLKWWESRIPVYPRLSKLMAKKLCVVATSVPSERIFLKTGLITSEKRSHLRPAKVRSLVFLNTNLPQDKRNRQKKP